MSLGRLALTVCTLGLAASAGTVGVPRKSPELAIHMAGGKDLRLSQYRGKVCVVALISTTCPHCQGLTRTLNAIQEEYRRRGVQIMAAAFNENAKDLVAGFIAEFNAAFPVGWLTRAEALAYLGIPVSVNSGYVPKLLFIDRAGIVREEHLQRQPEDDYFGHGQSTIRETLDRLLKSEGHKKTPVPRSTKAQK
ncbi:MAG TPA: TlpA disulfide reductase family protein [Bryobacteraceae bacterium]|jgi:thiol-disulfide isomerase/thioredoxin|nr:TlpA disulfide reductase family protein [Bryobacteraceae bacterium]